MEWIPGGEWQSSLNGPLGNHGNPTRGSASFSLASVRVFPRKPSLILNRKECLILRLLEKMNLLLNIKKGGMNISFMHHKILPI